LQHRTPLFQCRHTRHNHQQASEVLRITAMKCRFLSLLLNSTARRCRRATVHSLRAAATAFLFGRTLVVVAAVIIVVIDLHLPRCRLVDWCGLGRRAALFLLSWRCRHAWRGRLADALHGRQTLRSGWCRWVVCSLGWVIRGGRALLIHSPHLRGTAIRRRRYLHWLRRRTLHLDLIKPRACLLGRRPLDALVVFPLTDALGSNTAWSLFPFACGSISGELCVGRWRRPTGNLRHTSVRVVLVRCPWESTAGRRSRVANDRPNLRARAGLTVETLYRGVTRWRLNAIRGRRRAALSE
jgi:hypothetical protein